MKKNHLIIAAVCVSVLVLCAGCGQSSSSSNRDCPICSGADYVISRVDGSKIQCPVCGGEGSITQERYNELSSKYVKCAMCNGSGTTYDSFFENFTDCMWCKGYGKVTELEYHFMYCLSPKSPMFSNGNDSYYPTSGGGGGNSSSNDDRCDICHGTGRCSICHGEGYTHILLSDRNPCSSCDGRVNDYEMGWRGDGRCHFCHGTGRTR